MPDLGNSQQPAAEQKASTELPEWAKPYAKDILAKGQALTDVTQNPYQQYDQARIAGFSPMQQQAMQNAQGMSVSPQTGEATAGATMAGIGGLGVAGQANQYGFQNQVGGYMNPYLQMSLAPQLAEANRAYDIGATKQQSAATQAGAFGGSREALMAAENERNRNTGLNQIVGQGYNTAYDKAANQFNTEQNFGLQAQNANNQYGLAALTKQADLGATQRGIEGEGIAADYAQFKEERDDPFKKVQYQQSLLQGMPLATQSYNYTQPSTVANAAGTAGGLTALYNQLFTDAKATTPATPAK